MSKTDAFLAPFNLIKEGDYRISFESGVGGNHLKIVLLPLSYSPDPRYQTHIPFGQLSLEGIMEAVTNLVRHYNSDKLVTQIKELKDRIAAVERALTNNYCPEMTIKFPDVKDGSADFMLFPGNGELTDQIRAAVRGCVDGMMVSMAEQERKLAAL